MSKYQPLELPRGKKYGNNYYITYSVKLQRNVILYSQLEYHNFLTLEMNPRVIDFCEQPLQITIEIDEKLGTSIFDMWVSYDNGKEEFQEIKYNKDLNIHNKSDDRVYKQIQKQKKWCYLNGYDYSLRTETDIYIGSCYISNLRYLHVMITRNKKYLTVSYTKQIILHIKDSKVNILNLTQTLNLPVHTLFSSIAFGIYSGKLSADLENKVFSYDTSLLSSLWF